MLIDFNPLEGLLLSISIVIVIVFVDKFMDLLDGGYVKKGYCYAS